MVTLSMPILGWSFGPCLPIAKACMQQGGYTDKKAMIKGCVIPVVQGQKTLPNTNFTSSQLQQCKMEIIEKVKAKDSGSM
jgi:hypothetical protein